MKTFLILFLSFIGTHTFAQDYDHIIYKQEFDQVYSIAIDSLDYKKALVIWDQLREKHQYVHTED